MPRTERPNLTALALAQLTIYRYTKRARARAFNGIGTDNPRAIVRSYVSCFAAILLFLAGRMFCGTFDGTFVDLMRK